MRSPGDQQHFLDIPERRITVPDGQSHEISRGEVIGRWRARDSASDGSVVRALIGPAGTGKTALLAEYARLLESDGGRVVWLSVSVADNSTEHLRWSAAAALAALPGANLELDADWVRHTSLSDLLEAVHNDTAARRSSMHLFIDDIHLLESPDAVAELSELWRWASNDVHFHLAGFFEPPGLLSRARLTGALHLVDGNTDLVFTADEVLEVCTGQGIDFERGGLEMIYRQTLGWPAAVRLITLRALEHSAAQTVDEEVASELIDSITADVTLADYVSGIEPDDRQILRDLAVVDNLTDELVEAIAPEAGALALLDQLREHGLPISFGPAGSSITLHPLLLRALRSESWLNHDRTRLAARRAAQWFIATHQPVSAVRVAVSSRDAVTVRQTIEHTIAELLLTADLTEIVDLMGELPDDAAGLEIARTLRVELECISGRLSPRLDYAPGLSHEMDGEVACLLTNAVALSLAASRGTHPDTDFVAFAETLRELSRSARMDACRVAASLYLAIAASGRRDLVGADLAIKDGMEQLRVARLEAAQTPFAYLSVCVLGWSGRYRECVDALDIADELTGRYGLAPQYRRVEAVARAAAAYSRHLLAPDSPQKALADTAAAATTDLVDQLIVGAAAAIDVDITAAWPPMLATVAIETTWRLVYSSRPVDAHHYVRNVASRFGRTAETLVCEAIVYDGSARIRHAPKALSEALALIEPTAADAHTRVWAHLLSARIAHRAGDSAAVFAHALAAAEAGAPERVLAPFTVFEEVPEIYSENAGRFGSVEEFVSVIRSTRQRPSPARLSPTELAVLRDLPSWRSVEEIAADRHVSVNTVKSQLRSMYRKLSVSTRRDAIAAGHRAGLI